MLKSPFPTWEGGRGMGDLQEGIEQKQGFLASLSVIAKKKGLGSFPNP
jgi:hypothetical protein